MKPATFPLIALIAFSAVGIIAMVDGCADTPPALVHVDRVESLCDHVNRRQIDTLRLCQDTVDALRGQLCACRGIQDACSGPIPATQR